MDAVRIASVTDAWWEYVEQKAAGDSQADIARKLGVNKTTIWRWKDQRSSADHEMAIRFARAYNLPVAEALVAAGHITEDEAKLTEVRVRIEPSDLDADELAAETKRFVDEMRSRIPD